MLRPGRFWGICTLLYWIAGAPVGAAPVIKTVKTGEKPVQQYGKLELTVDLKARFANPFDDNEVRLDAVFTSPKGKSYSVPGFYWQDYTRTLEKGAERLRPNGVPAWKVRFTPPVSGIWKYRLSLSDPTGETHSQGSFNVSPARSKGFIRRCPHSTDYLCYDDGSPYFIVGENMGWAGPRGTYDYDDWLSALGKAGGNWIRVWLVHWNMGLEWTKSPPDQDERGDYPGLGRYSLDNAWRIDRVLDLAQRNGVGVMLTLGTYSQLKGDKGFFNEQAWDQNPYNTKNGGPAKTPAEFFTNTDAKALYKRKLRYLAARYGYSTALQSWEFFNETDAPAAWVGEMGHALRGLDASRHLISTTYGNDDVWKLPDIDFTQSHNYGEDTSLRDSAPVIAGANRELTTRFKKPHLMAEFGIDWKEPDRKYDPNGQAINLHNGLWASATTRGMGGAALWWWDNYVHPLNLYHEFTPLAKFAAQIPWGSREWTFLKSAELVESGVTERFTDLAIPATSGWGKPPGDAIYTLQSSGQITGGPVPQYLYSTGKPDLRSVPVFHVKTARPAHFSVHVQDVMTDARLTIRLDGKTMLEQELPAGEGNGPWKSSEYQTEWKTYKATYDRDYGIDVPPGDHVIQVENGGGDWMLVSEYRLTNYRSSRYPEMRVTGLRGGDQAILWLQDEASNWKEVQKGTPPRRWEGLSLRLPEFSKGRYTVTWWDTRKGSNVKTEAVAAGSGGLRLKVPPFRRDLAAHIKEQ